MSALTVYGLASQSVVKILQVNPEDLPLTVLEFLHQHDIPIASSCFGEGACKRCLINKTILSCQITVERLIKTNPQLTIEVSYL